LTGFEAVPGHGIRAKVDRHRLLVGNRAHLAAYGVEADQLEQAADRAALEGQTPMFVAVDDRLAGLVCVADTIRPEAANAVALLGSLGLEVWMLTGDNRLAARAVAVRVGITHVIAETKPADKAAQVARLQEQGHVVAMAGDGINDSPALAQADLGIAIGTGTDVAIAASDITLVGGDLHGIITAIALSRRTVTTIRQGLAWAFAYNLLLIPVAAGALYWWHHLLLDPVLASAAMAMSSVSVVTNAQRLRRFKPPSSAGDVLRHRTRARAGQYAYLAGVGALALALGSGFTWASHTEAASHGMNGILAWTEGMGMPMQPAMSVMETTEADPVSPRDAGLVVGVHAAAGTRPGIPTELTITVRDARTGAPVRDLARTHQVWMHVIIARTDLRTFAHIHPDPTNVPGQYRVTTTLPAAGRYLVHTEFRRQGQMTDVVAATTLTVGHPSPATRRLTRPHLAEVRSVVLDGVRITLGGRAHVGSQSDFRLTFADATTGAPVADLQPYLGAPGHVVVMRADASTFQHDHAEAFDSQGRIRFAVPGSHFGPELELHARLHVPGSYRLWAQFRLGDGAVVTAPFVVNAR
jgi:Cu+-exporting ATPase